MHPNFNWSHSSQLGQYSLKYINSYIEDEKIYHMWLTIIFIYNISFKSVLKVKWKFRISYLRFSKKIPCHDLVKYNSFIYQKIDYVSIGF